MVKNYMEIIIDEKMPKILKNYTNICKCDKCIQDIKAIALNNLKPKYVVTEKGLVYTRTNELALQFEIDVTREIIKAIEIVSKNPKHEVVNNQSV